jgi:hypothetical protein
MRKRSSSDRVLSVALLAPFLAAIVYLYYWKGAAYDSFIFGSGSWGVGCILKLVLYHGVVRRLRHDRSRILGVSALNGLVSGATELGAALVFFAFLPALSFWDVVAFGVGIGTIEALVAGTSSTSELLQGTRLEKAAGDLENHLARLSGPRRVWYAYLLPFAERLIAGVIHVGTRGLVYVAYRTADPVPFVLALGAFLLADGILGYRLLMQGRLTEPRVLNRTYLALAVIASTVLTVFLLSWPDRKEILRSPVGRIARICKQPSRWQRTANGQGGSEGHRASLTGNRRLGILDDLHIDLLARVAEQRRLRVGSVRKSEDQDPSVVRDRVVRPLQCVVRSRR